MNAATTPASSHYTLPTGRNYAIAAGVALFHFYALFLLPLLLPASALYAVALLPFFWLFSTHWGLVHEAIHKSFDTAPSRNERAGRTLAILMGASFHILKFGHLTHHQLNRDWHPEFVEKRSSGAWLAHYYTLLFGLYLSEVVSGFLLALLPERVFTRLARSHLLKDYPQVAETGDRFFYRRGHIRKLRQDVLAIALLYGAAFALYGTYWPVLLAFIFARMLVISFMDNIYHYGTAADNSEPGKALRLPRWASALLLHGNYHGTHHVDPKLPWTALPLAHANMGGRFDGGFVMHGLAQFKGPTLRGALHPAATNPVH